MKNFKVTIEYVGLTGAYRSQVEVVALNHKSASRKAMKTAGNRGGDVIAVQELIPSDVL